MYCWFVCSSTLKYPTERAMVFGLRMCVCGLCKNQHSQELLIGGSFVKLLKANYASKRDECEMQLQLMMQLQLHGGKDDDVTDDD
jgi:hypothetical protein